MVGTILNVITVAIGSIFGLLIGDRLPQKTQQSVVTGLGLVTLAVGIDNTQQSGNIIIPLISLVIGILIGEWLDIQTMLDKLGGRLQTLAARQSSGREGAAEDESTEARERFINGFVTASLVFCVGPLTFVGSLQDGISGDYQLLAIKSVLDGFAALAFAASLGVGVMFSIITVIVVQGSIALLGMAAGEVMSDAMIQEMTATGGLLLIGLALVLLDIQKPRVANFLPALLIAPILIIVANTIGIDIYPFD